MTIEKSPFPLLRGGVLERDYNYTVVTESVKRLWFSPRYDSDAKSSGSEGEEERDDSEEERAKEKSRKRKKDSAKASRPAKRAKEARLH